MNEEEELKEELERYERQNQEAYDEQTKANEELRKIQEERERRAEARMKKKQRINRRKQIDAANKRNEEYLQEEREYYRKQDPNAKIFNREGQEVAEDGSIIVDDSPVTGPVIEPKEGDIDTDTFLNESPYNIANMSFEIEPNQSNPNIIHELISGGSGNSSAVINFTTENFDWFGQESFTITLDDGESSPVNQSFLVTVNNVNDSPTIEDIIEKISNKKTGEVYKNEDDWKAKGVSEEDIQRDVTVVMPSLDLFGKTK